MLLVGNSEVWFRTEVSGVNAVWPLCRTLGLKKLKATKNHLACTVKTAETIGLS